MTLAGLRKAVKKPDHGLQGYYSGGELFINSPDGETVFNRYLDWETAQELCDELEITLTEV